MTKNKKEIVIRQILKDLEISLSIRDGLMLYEEGCQLNQFIKQSLNTQDIKEKYHKELRDEVRKIVITNKLKTHHYYDDKYHTIGKDIIESWGDSIYTLSNFNFLRNKIRFTIENLNFKQRFSNVCFHSSQMDEDYRNTLIDQTIRLVFKYIENYKNKDSYMWKGNTELENYMNKQLWYYGDPEGVFWEWFNFLIECFNGYGDYKLDFNNRSELEYFSDKLLLFHTSQEGTLGLQETTFHSDLLEMISKISSIDKKLLMDDSCYLKYQELLNKVKVYRGVVIHHDNDRQDFDYPCLDSDINLSWTTSKTIGKWFGTRYSNLNNNCDCYLLTGYVDKEDILFFNDSRNEEEVISDKVEIESETIIKESFNEINDEKNVLSSINDLING